MTVLMGTSAGLASTTTGPATGAMIAERTSSAATAAQAKAIANIRMVPNLMETSA
jgi:hypothetical protein